MASVTTLLRLNMPEEEAFWLPIDVLVKQDNWQEGVKPIPQSVVDEWYAWRMQKGCPPNAVIYKTSNNLSPKTPIGLIDFSVLGLKKLYTRVKGEKIKTVYFWQDIKVLERTRVYEYDNIFVPTKKTTYFKYFDFEENVCFEKSETLVFDDRAIAYNLRKARFKQNEQDIVVWLNEDIGLEKPQWNAFYAYISAFLEPYYGGIYEYLIEAIVKYPDLDSAVKTELIERLTP